MNRRRLYLARCGTHTTSYSNGSGAPWRNYSVFNAFAKTGPNCLRLIFRTSDSFWPLCWHYLPFIFQHSWCSNYFCFSLNFPLFYFCLFFKIWLSLFNALIWAFLLISFILGVPATSRILTGDSQKLSFSILKKGPFLIFKRENFSVLALLYVCWFHFHTFPQFLYFA